ncbi:unnamed protein product, partial [Closterium sp. NIES-54]
PGPPAGSPTAPPPLGLARPPKSASPVTPPQEPAPPVPAPPEPAPTVTAPPVAAPPEPSTSVSASPGSAPAVSWCGGGEDSRGGKLGGVSYRCNPTVCIRLVVRVQACVYAWNEPLGAVSTMAGPEERGGRGAGGNGEAQAQGQPRNLAMAPVQPSLGPPRDEPRVFGLDKFNGDNFAEWSFKMENIFDHYDLLEVMEGTEKRPENDPEKSPWVRKSAKGYLLLGQALGSGQIRLIKPFVHEPEQGPKAWGDLKGVHAPTTAVVAVVLEWQKAALRIKEDETVDEGVQKFLDLLTRLEGGNLNYSEHQKKTNLLALLPESWSSLICGAIASSSLMDGPLLKAKRVEEQEEGEEEAVEAVAVVKVELQV